jgi:hypothetical protein
MVVSLQPAGLLYGIVASSEGDEPPGFQITPMIADRFGVGSRP